MAKNWMIPEVVTAMVDGDESAIQDFTKRNPLASNLIAKAISGDTDAMVKFFMNVPEYLSLRKMESVLKEDVEPFEEDGKEKKAKAPKKEKKEKAEKADKKEKSAKKEKKEKEKEVDGDIKSHPLYGLTKKSELKDASGKDLMSFKKMAGISGKDWGKGKDDAIAAVIKWNKANAKGKAKPKKEEEAEEKPAKKDKKKGNKKKDKKEKDTKKKKAKKEEVEDDDDDDEDWDF